MQEVAGMELSMPVCPTEQPTLPAVEKVLGQSVLSCCKQPEVTALLDSA